MLNNASNVLNDVLNHVKKMLAMFKFKIMLARNKEKGWGGARHACHVTHSSHDSTV